MGRFYRKSLETGWFFGDVRMTPQHFDKLVALATPHLPVPARGPSPIHPTYRIFATLFWLAQGGRQRVIARAVDVAESTFSKHCAPVVAALLAGLPKPEWPGAAERKRIGRDFAALTGGNASGWSGLCGAVDGCLTPFMTPFGEHKEDYSDRRARCSMLLIAITDTRRIRFFVGGFPGSRGDSLAFRAKS